MFIKVRVPWNVMIPAEDMDTGLKLQRAIIVRLFDAFASKKATRDLGYFITLTTLEAVDKGTIREHTSEVVFPVFLSGISFKIFEGEIVQGVVNKVLKSGILLSCGPCENVYLPENARLQVYSRRNPMFVNQDMSWIQINTMVRFVVIATQWKEAEREFIALASIDEDNIGPF